MSPTTVSDHDTEVADACVPESPLVTGEQSEVDDDGRDPADAKPTRRRRLKSSWSRVAIFGVLPLLAGLLAAGSGWMKFEASSAQVSEVAGRAAVQAASDSAVAILSYNPSSVEKDLAEAESRLTGRFRESYSSLIHDVVIPGSKERQISAVATVPAAALVSATHDHAVVLLAINQAVVVGQDAPSQTASSVRVALDKIDGRWLISAFDPV